RRQRPRAHGRRGARTHHLARLARRTQIAGRGRTPGARHYRRPHDAGRSERAGAHVGVPASGPRADGASGAWRPWPRYARYAATAADMWCAAACIAVRAAGQTRRGAAERSTPSPRISAVSSTTSAALPAPLVRPTRHPLTWTRQRLELLGVRAIFTYVGICAV